MTEIFAVSISGHDKNKLYVIVGKDDRWVYLADGIRKTAEHPKKKNVKHIQFIKNEPEEIRTVLKSSDTLSDLNIKRAIKLYLNAE